MQWNNINKVKRYKAPWAEASWSKIDVDDDNNDDDNAGDDDDDVDVDDDDDDDDDDDGLCKGFKKNSTNHLNNKCAQIGVAAPGAALVAFATPPA